MTLSVRERMALRLAGEHYAWLGAQHAAVKEQVGLSAGAWSQLVHVLIWRADTEAEEPALVYRLRRLEERRAMARGASLDVSA